MNRNSIRKGVIILSFLSLFAFNVAAQVQTTGPVEFLNSIAQELSNQEMLEWLEADSIWEVLIFLGVPIAGFYAITRLIVTKGIEFAEGNFRENTPDRITRSSDDLSDLADWSAKILSIGIAVIATIQYGGYFYNITSILALAVLTGIIWVFFTGSGGLFTPLPFGTPSLPSFRNNNDTEGAEEAAEDGQEQLDRGGEEVEESETDAEQGNMGDADREAEAAAQHIEQAIQDIEIAEEDLQSTFQRVQNEVMQTLDELEQTAEINEDEEQIIQRISKLPEEVIEFIDEIISQVDPDNPTAQDYIVRGEEETIERLFHEAEEVNQSLNRLLEEIEEEGGEEQKEERELLMELRELIEVHKLLKKIGNEIKLGRKEDQELEKIAEKLQDTSLYNEIEAEENQEKQLLEQLKELQSQEEEIDAYIEKADKIITHIATLDNQEIQQLQGEDKEYQQAAEKVGKYLQDLENYDMDSFETSDGLVIGEIVERLKERLIQIDEKIEKAGNMETQDLERVEEMKSELENLISNLQ